MPLLSRHRKALTDRGLDEGVLEMSGVESLDTSDAIKIPYYRRGRVVNHKYRAMGPEKRYWQDADALKCFWNEDVVYDPDLRTQTLIIFEGEFDAMIAIQCGFVRSISVPDGAPPEQQRDQKGPKYEYITEEFLKAIAVDTQVIIATDGDEVGGYLLQDLALRIGRARSKFLRYPRGTKDINEVFQQGGYKAVVQVISAAEWVHQAGVYSLRQLPPIPYAKPHEIGIPGLNPHYRARLGDFVVLTGIPGHGKTSLANHIQMNLLWRFGWQPAVASFEATPQRDYRRGARVFFHAMLSDGGMRQLYENELSPEEKDQADNWIDENFSFIVPSEDDDVSLEWMLEKIKVSVLQRGARTALIDPWNEMDHVRPPDMSQTEYVGFAIKQLRKVFRKYMIHGMVVAHPAKIKSVNGKLAIPTLYDISDSSHWYNKCEVGIVVHRESKNNYTRCRIEKTKHVLEIGRRGDVMLLWDPQRNRFMSADGAEEFGDEPPFA